MRSNWRRVYVALSALQIVLAAYLLFTYLGGKSRIRVEKTSSGTPQTATDANEVGRLGPLGVGTVEKARFVNFDENKQVSREFGFEELLHKTGDQWDVEKPFLNLYQQDFDCRITSESAVVFADELGDTADIKEATLKGNVIVHIVPKKQNSPGPVDIYLDDIVFISNRSMFLTAGPVKILAGNMQLLGRGLELIYNYPEDRLELFRIIDLESLCLNRISNRADPGRTSRDNRPADGQNEIIVADTYRAVLNTDVVVRSAAGVLVANDKFTIRNIIRRKDRTTRLITDTRPQELSGIEDTSPNDFLDVVVTCHEGLVVCPMDISVPQGSLLTKTAITPTGPNLPADMIAERNDTNSLTAKNIDYDASTGQAIAEGPVVLTYFTHDDAAGGNNMVVTITAQDKLTFGPDSRRIVFEGNCVSTFVQNDLQKPRRYTVTAPKITAVLAAKPRGDKADYLQQIAAQGGVTAIVHDIQTGRDLAQFTAPRIEYFTDGGNITATGQSQLMLWSRPEDSQGQAQATEPVRITAEEKVQFTPALNTIVFEGNCFCETVQHNASQSRKYTLHAERISVELDKEQKNASALATAGVKKVIASQDAVVTAISSDQRKVAEFTANQIEYDSANENVSAAGLSRLLFFADGAEQSGSTVDAPVAITAQESTIFSLASNQALFRGQCVCTMIRTDTGTARKYKLTAPEVAVDIASSDGGVFGSSGIDYLTAGDNALIVVTPVDSDTELARFTASRIKYHAAGGSIVADGPCDFTFYANDFMPTQTLGSAVPVRINAKKNTTFLPAENQITFRGDCICTMVRSRLDSQNKFTLSAPVLTIDLSKQAKQDLTASTLGIEKFTADGGVVQISSVKTMSERLTAFNKIKCNRFVYNTEEKLFTAAGPGVITVDNSKIDESGEPAGRLSITKRCYAFLRDFETLRFDLRTNRILVRNNENKMLADYFPIVNGQNAQQIKASAGAVEIHLTTDTNGRNEISALRAFEGITYEDQDNQFMAGEMSYDARTSVAKAKGSDFHRCYLNGAIVDNIVYDLNRRAVLNIDMTDPGRVQALK